MVTGGVRPRATTARQRDRAQAASLQEFAAAVFRWLDFAPQHQTLATEVSVGAVEHAARVANRMVGRARMLPVDERAALAARSFIRHRHTDYDERLLDLDPLVIEADGADYRRVLRTAHRLVDEFLEEHRHR